MDGTPKPEESQQASQLNTLTRLIIGGVVIGYDGLVTSLQRWEAKAAPRMAKPPAVPSRAEAKPLATEDAQSQVVPQVVQVKAQEAAEETALFRYALIGLAFDLQEQIGRSAVRINHLANKLGDASEPVVSPIFNSRLFSPVRNRINRWVERGEDEVSRWIETGKREEQLGLVLTETAIHDTVDTSINYMAGNEEIQVLIQSQSVSLLDEIISEVRERSVSADDLIESILRRILRRPLRSELPPPPEHIRALAIGFRQLRGRRVVL